MQEEHSFEERQEEVILFTPQKVNQEHNSLAFPWYSEHTRKLTDPILRMHNEAIELYLYLSPLSDPFALTAHEQLYQKVEQILKVEQPNTTVVSPFFSHKLYLRGTQIEIYLLVDELNQKKAFSIVQKLKGSIPGNRIVQIQNQQKYALYQYELQLLESKAIVRIVEKQDWEEYLALVDDSLVSIVELKYLYMILACMIRQRWLHLSIRPVLLLGLLSVFYHQRRKQRHRTLTENIIKFVEYYGVGPFQERRVNYLGKGRYELLQEGHNQTPFSFWINPRCNISSPLLRQFFAVLKNRYRMISNYNFDEEQSIIGSLVNPCSRQFEYV